MVAIVLGKKPAYPSENLSLSSVMTRGTVTSGKGFPWQLSQEDLKAKHDNKVEPGAMSGS